MLCHKMPVRRRIDRCLVALGTAAILLTLSSCADSADSNPAKDAAKLPGKLASLAPLHRPLEKPRPGDWLDQHQEPGQTYAEYLRCRPTRADKKRRAIYVQPLGKFDENQRRIVKLSAECLELYFGLPTKMRDELPLSVIPDEARRKHPTWGVDQILSTYVLDSVLVPRLPDDACAYLALTGSDLWPGKGWNFVFGQASLSQRVGVWSIHRNGNPSGDDDEFRLCLLRTLKTATHETGHMFSMMHCTLYECNMCGSNNRDESDRRPLEVCPHCLAKIVHATGVDPASRCEKLAKFCRDNALKPEAEFYEKTLAALRK